MQTLNDAQEKDWELDIFIPTELLNKVMEWLCAQQTPEGAFIEHSPIYDRKMRVGLGTLETTAEPRARCLITAYDINGVIAGW